MSLSEGHPTRRVVFCVLDLKYVSRPIYLLYTSASKITLSYSSFSVSIPDRLVGDAHQVSFLPFFASNGEQSDLVHKGLDLLAFSVHMFGCFNVSDTH